MDEKLRKSKEIEHWARFKDSAESFWGWTSDAGTRRAARRARFLISHGEIKPGKKILEVGCGTGIFTEKLAQTGAEVLAIDLSPDLLMKARNRVLKNNVNLIEADLEKLPFDKNSFDSVVGVSILHHVDLGKALREIYRVLKVGGKIVFSEPNMLNPQIMIMFSHPRLRKLIGATETETPFFRWSLNRSLKEVGFSYVNIKPFDFLHPKIPKNLINLVERTSFIIEKIPLLKEFSGSLLITADK